MNSSRRQFICSTATAAAAIAIAPQLFAAEATKKRAYKKAMMWDTIGYKGSVLEKCRAVKAAGFQGVEPSSHMNLDEVVKALEETGLHGASVCCSTLWNLRLSAPDEAVRVHEAVQEVPSGVRRR